MIGEMFDNLFRTGAIFPKIWISFRTGGEQFKTFT